SAGAAAAGAAPICEHTTWPSLPIAQTPSAVLAHAAWPSSPARQWKPQAWRPSLPILHSGLFEAAAGVCCAGTIGGGDGVDGLGYFLNSASGSAPSTSSASERASIAGGD